MATPTIEGHQVSEVETNQKAVAALHSETQAKIKAKGESKSTSPFSRVRVEFIGTSVTSDEGDCAKTQEIHVKCAIS